MFDHRHYVPVLKAKRAEFPAIGELKSKAMVTPLFEAVPVGKRPKSIPDSMEAVWVKHQPYFVDFLYLDDESLNDGEEHPLQPCFLRAAELGHVAIPVTGTGRSSAYQHAARKIAAEQENGYAIRLMPDDFENEDELNELVDALTALMEQPRTQTDMIIDLGSIVGGTEALITQMERAYLMMLPAVSSWRTLSIVSGAFPKGLGPMQSGTWNSTARTDWLAWRRLATGKNKLSRLPAFGDYAIRHPDLPPTGQATILAQLRYTTPESFLTWKGLNAIKKGFDQFFGICKDLVGRPEYRGSEFSYGDREISERVGAHDSPGSAETWQKIGTNHHVETVIEQIANLP